MRKKDGITDILKDIYVNMYMFTYIYKWRERDDLQFLLPLSHIFVGLVCFVHVCMCVCLRTHVKHF